MSTNQYIDLPAHVTTINSLSGAITLAAGSNITLTTSGHTITIASSGGGGSISLDTFGSTPNADGLTLTGTVLNMEPADGTHPGGVSTDSQTFAGVKTFTDGLSSTGVISVSASGIVGVINVTADNNDHAGIRVQNVNSGVNATAAVVFQNDINELGFFFVSSSNYSGNVVAGPSSAAFYANAANGFGFDMFAGSYRFAISEVEIIRFIPGAVGIFNAAPAYPLDVTGGINTSTQYNVGGVAGFTGSGIFTSFDIVGGIITNAT